MQIPARKGRRGDFKAKSSIGGLAKVEGQSLKLNQSKTHQGQRGIFYS